MFLEERMALFESSSQTQAMNYLCVRKNAPILVLYNKIGYRCDIYRISLAYITRFVSIFGGVVAKEKL